MCSTRSDYLMEISQELTRFQIDLQGKFRCPTCLQDYSLDSKAITEEHIVPDSQGGKVTTFLCNPCNSFFGRKQTRWLSDWIDLNEGGAPFHSDPKKQKARVTSNGNTLSASLSIADDGAIEIFSDKSRSDPKQYESYWNDENASTLKVDFSVPVFANESALKVGFLTAAYGLWFKHFGYSFVLQSVLDPVRRQILHPEENIVGWNFLIEIPDRRSLEPELGLMRFGAEIFPIAAIYDHIVILPNAKKPHPDTTDRDAISTKLLSFDSPIAQRYQGRCVGPAVLICDFQTLIEPDKVKNATMPPQHMWIDGW